jgi:MFS transporter, AAHS family, 4-hydroxybenzoate transporter
MSNQTVDVQAFIDRHPLSKSQRYLFVLCFLTMLIDGFDTAVIGYAAPSLLKEWALNKLSLGPLLSAAMFGVAAGSLLSGPIADRVGRKTVLLVAVFGMGALTLATAWTTNLTEMTILRCLTGLALGTAMPNAVTLTNEYCPGRRRALLTNAMFCGFSVGAGIGGLVAAWMLPIWGWRSLFVLGGVLPLALTVMMLGIPESVRFLVARTRDNDHAAAHAKIGAVLRRIAPLPDGVHRFALHEGQATTRDAMSPSDAVQSKRGLAVVFSSAYRGGSLLLWLTYFMGLVIFYAIVNWMPLLFKDAGLTPTQAVLVSALFPLGGIGAVISGWLMDRFNHDRIVATGFLFTALFVYAIGQANSQLAALVACVMLAGLMANTSQASLPGLAACYYPTVGRATGVSWMMGMGRFGGIAGSFLVAELARRQFTFEDMFMVLAVPAAVAAGSLLMKSLIFAGARGSHRDLRDEPSAAMH